MCGAPLLANTSSIFDYLQKTNGIYNIPLFAIIVVGMLTKFVPKMAANVALFVGVVLIAFLTFGDTCFGEGFINKITGGMNIYHVDTIVFLILVAIMGIWSIVAPRKEAFVQQDAKAVDMTPWKFSWVAGGLLLVLVALIYASFADFSALKDKETEPVPYHWGIIATEVAQKEMKILEIDETEQGVILTEITASIDEFDKSTDKPADKAVTRKIVYQTIGKHYAEAKGFTEAQIKAFNEIVEREAAVSMKEADDLKAATESAVVKFFNKAIEDLKKGAEDVKAGAEDAAKKAEGAANDLAADASKTAKKTGETFKTTVDEIGDDASKTAKKTGDTVKTTADDIATGVSNLFKKD